MSAIPRFWPASRAAARRRVSRRGFFAVAGAHLAAVAGVFLLSAGPAVKVTVAAAGRKDTPAAAAVGSAAEPPLTPAEREAVVWMDPATFETPPSPATPAPPEPAAPLAPPPSLPSPPLPPSSRHPVREPFLSPTPRPVSPRPKHPPVVAPVPPRKTPPPSPARIAVRPRPQPFPAIRRPAANDAPDNPATPGRGSTTTTTGAGDGDGGDNDDSPAGAGGTDWYASMLHERFHARWEQPTSVFASARRYTATLRLRIERDGRISDFRLVRPSGLVPMDESVLAAAARVSRVDPPPGGLLRGGAYVVNVGFVRE